MHGHPNTPEIRIPSVRHGWLVLLLAGAQLGAALGQTGPNATAGIAVDGPAFLRTWCPPVYPSDALRKKVEGRVTVRLVVDANGNVASARVLSSSDPELDAAALDTARRWNFTPALDAGIPVACSMDAPVVFSLRSPVGGIPGMPPNGQIPQLSPTTAARPLNTPDVDFPDVLFDRKVPGRVLYSCDVLPNGRTENPHIKRSSHADFVVPALKMLSECRFSPAMQGELAIKSSIEGRITFDALNGAAANMLTANMISEIDGSPPLDDVILVTVVDPVWPYDLLLRGVSGSATATFSLNEGGLPRNLRITEASDPEFGEALAAAIELCEYAGSSASGHPLVGPLRPVALLKQRAQFHAMDDSDPDANPIARLRIALLKGAIGDGQGLDGKPEPVYQVEPVYPSSLDRKAFPTGDAQVEFIVDRTGRVRMPRIVSSSERRFGWAAATAVSQWVFSVPTRGGRPVDVKLRRSFPFNAPEASQDSYSPPNINDRRP